MLSECLIAAAPGSGEASAAAAPAPESAQQRQPEPGSAAAAAPAAANGVSGADFLLGSPTALQPMQCMCPGTAQRKPLTKSCNGASAISCGSVYAAQLSNASAACFIGVSLIR